MMGSIELKNEEKGKALYSINVDGERIGSIWINSDNSVTVKVNPHLWETPFKLDEEMSHLRSYEGCIVIRPVKPLEVEG